MVNVRVHVEPLAAGPAAVTPPPFGLLHGAGVRTLCRATLGAGRDSDAALGGAVQPQDLP
jgi:hypothetical protein